MRHQAIRPVALMLGFLLVAAGPARAATITFEDVVRAVGSGSQVRPADEVRLRLAQSGRPAAQTPPAQSGESSTPQQQLQSGGSTAGDGSLQTQTTTQTPDPSLSQSGGQVETVDLGDVTGTVCDCGEIPALDIPKGGFPWWLLGGIPLICVSGVCFGDGDEDCIVNCGPGPTPTPTPNNPVPEPATLLLFGSGLLALGARARRRYGRKGFDAASAAAPAEEV